ncbi:hypothetical protein EG347_08680 [Chryseobacterium sp. G0186]|uniref:hypothetical protein n=1 Tax=Chryseobacterium sp. G0186 TaxID=2487064 RepID=UPI000F4FDDE4|nr:hypothetical protein [Chryseobacterium sp. G0186]AZA77583.1 hypothetical protein EG347_08680 [Chryseobacterium sp. G0186]
MKYLSALLAIILFQSCNQKKESEKNLAPQKEIQESKIQKDSILQDINKAADSKKDTLDEVMLENDIRFNGKLKRYFTLADFEKNFGKADSTKLLSEEEPCTSIFEGSAEDNGMNDKYFYKDGSRFENSGQKVAVDEFKFVKGNYILYKGIKIGGESTVNDLKKIFPNAIRDIGVLEVYGEGKLQLITLREDKEGISDGHINIFFKNNRIYYMHWWFPC